MFIVERYKIDDNYKVHNIITDTNPNGTYTYDPFSNNETLPFWGVMCTTFWGLNEANRNYIINNIKDTENIEKYQFSKYWLFWFSDGDLNNQRELFFMGNNAKEHALTVQHIFNHLLEKQVDRLIDSTKEEYSNYSLTNNNSSFYKDLTEQIKEEK